MEALVLTDQADSVRATRSRGGLLEPVGGEDRVEHADATDQPELDHDDQDEPGRARAR